MKLTDITSLKPGQIITPSQELIEYVHEKFPDDLNLQFGHAAQWAHDEWLIQSGFSAKNDVSPPVRKGPIDRIVNDIFVDDKVSLTNAHGVTSSSYTIGVTEHPEYDAIIEGDSGGGDVVITGFIQMEHLGYDFKFMGAYDYRTLVWNKLVEDGRYDLTKFFIRSKANKVALIV